MHAALQIVELEHSRSRLPRTERRSGRHRGLRRCVITVGPRTRCQHGGGTQASISARRLPALPPHHSTRAPPDRAPENYARSLKPPGHRPSNETRPDRIPRVGAGCSAPRSARAPGIGRPSRRAHRAERRPLNGGVIVVPTSDHPFRARACQLPAGPTLCCRLTAARSCPSPGSVRPRLLQQQPANGAPAASVDLVSGRARDRRELRR